jgi:hypothetical protein
MFDKAIIDTDRFMDMPMSAKAIYFLLGMEADDEGFVSYKKVMRIHGGNEDDVKVLTAKSFIIKFPSGVVVITDWNKNNWLDTRRIKPTEYVAEKGQLALTKDKTYTLSNGLASIEESRVEEGSTEQLAPETGAGGHQDIVDVIDSFKPVNPSYGSWFGNKTERAAIERMLKVHGKERLLQVISILPKSNTMPFVTTITSPYTLEKKWADLEATMRKAQNKEITNRPRIIM